MSSAGAGAGAGRPPVAAATPAGDAEAPPRAALPSSAAAKGAGGAKADFRIVVDPTKEEYVPGTFYAKERELISHMKILDDLSIERPDDAKLWRRYARMSYRLWHLNLDKKTLHDARNAFQKALGVVENQSNPALWAECALVYISAGAYEGAIQLLNNLMMDIPDFKQMPRVHIILASLYRRCGKYDMAFNFFVSALRGKGGPLPPPITQQHIITELAYTYELKARSLAGPAVDVLTSDLREEEATATGDRMNIFDAMPDSAAACAKAAREGYREGYTQAQAQTADQAAAKAAAAAATAGGSDEQSRLKMMRSFWRTPRNDGWKAWRRSWREWLGMGIMYGECGFDVLAADAFTEALSLGAGQFLTSRPAKGLIGEVRTNKIGVLESKFLSRRKQAMEEQGVDTSKMLTKHDEELEADAWLLAARCALRAGDDKLAPIAAGKVLERRPLSHFVTPTRSMLAKCGNAAVRELIERRAGHDLVFRLAVWRSRTSYHRKRYNATLLLVRAYRWYRLRKWARQVGRPRKWARAVLQRTFCYPRMELFRFKRRRAFFARKIQCWYRSVNLLRRLVWRREKWREIFRDNVRKSLPKLQAWFRGYPAHRRWVAYKWAVPIIQRAWRCFYARLTLYYLATHKAMVSVALKDRDLGRVGCMVMPRKFVRRHLKSKHARQLAELTPDERDELRRHNDRLAAARGDSLASLALVPDLEPAASFLDTLLASHIDAKGRIRRKARRSRAGRTGDHFNTSQEDTGAARGSLARPSSMPSLPSAGMSSLDTLSSLPSVGRTGSAGHKPVPSLAAPLHPYFLPDVWQRAHKFAAGDADKDADAILEGRDAAKRDKQMEKWATLRAKRDATLAGMKVRAKSFKPAGLGYGPEGPWHEQPPPVLSLLRAKAVPTSKPGLALATAVAVQSGTGLEAGMNLALGRGMASPVTRAGKNRTAASMSVPPLPPAASPVKARMVPPGKVGAKLAKPTPTPMDTFLAHSLREEPASRATAKSVGSRGVVRAGSTVPQVSAVWRHGTAVPHSNSNSHSHSHSHSHTAGGPTRTVAFAPDGDDLFFQSVDAMDLPMDGDAGSASSFSDSDPEELAAPYSPRARPDGVSGARGYVYAKDMAFSGSGIGGAQLRAEGSGWTRFKSTASSSSLWNDSIQRKSKFTAADDDDDDGDGDGKAVPARSGPHPRTYLPGRLCVEVQLGDAKAFYGRMMAKLAVNLVKWQRHAPFHWRGMLAKRAEDAVDVAMRTHHVDCEAKSCKVMKGLLELVRRARITTGYTLRDYVLYVRMLTKQWLPSAVKDAAAAATKASGSGAPRFDAAGLADLTFPLNGAPRPDVSVRQRVSSLASRAASIRQAKAGKKQRAVMTGGLFTTSMRSVAAHPGMAMSGSQPAYLNLSLKSPLGRSARDAGTGTGTGAGAGAGAGAIGLDAPGSTLRTLDGRPLGMAGATVMPDTDDMVDPELEAETRKFRAQFKALLLEQLRLRKWDSVAVVLDTMVTTEGMAPSLETLMTVVRSCVAPHGTRPHDGAYGPGEVAVKVVACASWGGATRSVDLYHAALRACLANKGHWRWAVYTYTSLQEAGCTPTDETHTLVQDVCAASITEADRDAAYAQLHAAGAPTHVCFNSTQPMLASRKGAARGGRSGRGGRGGARARIAAARAAAR